MKSRWFNIITLVGLLLGMVSPVTVQAAPASQPPAAVPSAPSTQENPPEVEQALLDTLAVDGSADFVIDLAEKADLSAAYKMTDWSDRGWYVYNTLLEVATRTQAPIVAYAKENGLEFETFFSNNTVHIQSGSLSAVQDIAALPGVASIRAPRVMQIDPDVLYGPDSPEATGWNLGELEPDSNLWGMQATQVWDQYGVKGDGIVVANIDTGVTYQHEALDRQYRGNLGSGSYDHDFNWYAPTTDAQVQCGGDALTSPCDEDGHGSGTAGIMVGETADMTEQLGAAPSAKWIACMGCDGYGTGGSGGCSDAALTGCADWFVAPCPAGVAPGDPSCTPDMRPHIINNSWGGGGGDDWYQGYVEAWVASGMFPAFSAGNTTACAAVGSPGDNPPSFGTAAHGTNGQNIYAGGPSNFFTDPSCDADAHEVDPHLNAPTYGRTASHVPGSYYNIGGTSGASPHTAGAIALIWSANPALVGDIETTFTILEQSSDRTSTQSWREGDCGKPACAGSDPYPNYEYGWGYLDALAAVDEALLMADNGVLDGTITDASTTTPIAGATVMATADSDGRVFQTTTDASGMYKITVFSDTYTVDASKYAYLPDQATGVAVTTDMTTTQDFALDPAATYTVDGTVTDATTGWPLYATVNIAGYIGDPVMTDPATGAYSVDLMEGIEYTFNVMAWADGYETGMAMVGPLTADVTEDFALMADMATCVAPGYEAVVDPTPLLTEDFDAGIPADWSVINNASGCVWTDTDPGGRGNMTGGSGIFAIIDTDDCGSGTSSDTDMQTPVLDTLSYDGIQIEYKNDYYDLGSTAELMVFDGSEWVTVDDLSGSSSRGPETRIASGPAGATDTQITWHYAGGWDWWWEVDDVRVYGVNCVAPTDGGLVVGTVSDAGLGEPLPGAEVFADTGEMVTASDPDAFYMLFAPSGSHTFTATMSGFSTEVATVDVAALDTTQLDFALDAGLIVATPDGFEVTLEAGENVKEWLSLDNIGGADAMYELGEIPGGYIPAMPMAATAPVLDASAIETLANALDAAPGNPSDVGLRSEPFAPTAVLYDNGPLVNSPGTGAGGMDESMLQGALGMTTLGVGHQVLAGNRIADDFIVSGGSWNIDQITFFAYQTNSGPPSTMTAVNLQIWDGDPSDPASSVIWGDTTTNVMVNTVWMDAYRVSDTSSGDTARPIMASTVDVGISLAPGTYWLDWQTDGSGSSGPWAPPITINGMTTTGNALQYASGAWQPALDTGTSMQQGFPFIIEGSSGGASGGAISWLTESPISGTVAAGDNQQVMLTFDASLPDSNQPGVYLGSLKLSTDTPYPPETLPVTMTVTAPADWGKIEGIVASLGYCDGEWNPLEGVEVLIESALGASWVVETDEDGYYAQWLDAMYGPVTVTASFDEHDSAVVGDVAVVTGGTTTQDLGLRWQAPCVASDPDTLEMTVAMGMSTTVPFTLSNMGAGSTPFDLVETDGGVTISQPLFTGPSPATGGKPERLGPTAQRTEPSGVVPNDDVIQDGGFEDGTPNSYWNEASTNYGTPICDLTSCGTGTGTGPYAGDYWTWLGGYSGYEEGSVDQDVVIPAGTATLSFWLEQIVCDSASDYMEVSIDGDVVFTTDGSSPLCGVFGYSQVTVDVSAYADGGTHNVMFYSEIFGNNGGGSNIFVDDVVLDVVAGGGGGGAIPWLDENPTSGTVSADDAAVIDVTFDASAAITQVTQPGEYFGTLNVNTDDPMMGSIAVPVTMTVTPPATWGKLAGTVNSNGYCDADPTSVPDVEVLVEASDGMTWTLMTDDMGMYVVWMDEASSPVTITFEIPEHDKAEITSVDIVAGATTTVDTYLRWLVPCVGATPDAVAATVELGATVTESLMLDNAGAAATDWDIAEASDWLSVDPVAGTLVADTGTAAVDVNFDAVDIEQPGEYTTSLTVTSDDPETSPLDVPVTMTVTAPATWGEFLGMVSSMGYCDVNPTTLAYPEFALESWTRTETVTVTNELLSEGFEAGFPPAGWVLTQTGATDDPGWVQTSLRANSGTYAAYHNDNNTNGNSVAWMILPQVSIPAGSFELGFWQNQRWPSYYEYHGIWVSTATDDPADFTELMDLGVGTEDTWEEKLVDLSAYAGQDIYLAFRYEGDWADEWYIDDVRVYEEYLATVPVAYEFMGDANGEYSYWLPADTYTVTLVADEHETVVGDVTIVGSAQTLMDYAMRWLEPCVAVSPDSIADTLAMGETSDHVLTIDNTGAGETTFGFTEFEEGYIMPSVAVPSAPVGMRVVTLGDFTISGDPNAVAGAKSAPAPAAARPEGVVGLTHSASQTIVDDNSVACGADGIVADNSFVRVFDLDAFGLADYLDVQVVEVGIQTAVAGSGGMQPGTINLYTLDGDLEFANMTLIGTADFDIADGDAMSLVSVPITGTAPAGSELVVEFYIPDGSADQHSFWPGSNDLGQTAPTYLASVACSIPEPTDTAAIGFPDMHLVMNVIGFTPEPVELPWLIEDPLTGTVAGDSSEQVTVTLDAGQVALPGTYLAKLKVNTDDPVVPGYDVAVAMTVTLPANFGMIEGTVYGTGYCDGEMTALSGAEVVIEGSDGVTVAVTTDFAGMYEAWRDELTGPYTVTAMAVDHLEDMVSGVIVTGTETTVQDVSLRSLQPCVSVPATELTAEVTLGMSETTTLDIVNDGAGDLTWELVEGEGGFTPMAGEDFLVVSEDNDAAGAMEAALTVLGYTYLDVESSGFTSMSVADLLTYQAVLYAGTVSSGSEDTQAIAYLEAGGRLLVADNDYAYYYCEGGSIGATLGPDYLQCEYVSDAGSDGVITGIDIMSGITADISDDPWPDDIVLFGPDAVGIFDAPSGNLAGLRIERNDYKAVLLAWDYNHIGASAAGDPEEVAILEAAIGYLTGAGGVPWLSEDPEADVTAMDSTSAVSVTFDAGVPEVTQPGVYTTTLAVVNDDAMYPEIVLPVTMTVLAPETWGNLEGTVTGLGYCDMNPMPIEGAVVFIESTTGMSWTLETDAKGMYDFWFDEMYSPVTVTFAYEAGYEAQTVSGVTIVSGTTTTLDADLRWYHSCVTTDEAVEVSVAMGTTDTFTLDLVNSGLISTPFGLMEGDWGFVVAAPLAVADAFGYTVADSDDAGGPAYDFIDISAAGTPLALGDDDFAGPVDLGFDFPFYGASEFAPNLYDEVYVNSNGFLSFGSGSTDLSNDVLPDLLTPNSIIALMWDDLVGGTAYVYTFDMCPYGSGMCTVVQYEGFTHVDGMDAGNWQVVLFETGNILVQFADAGDYAGASSTTGIENEYGTDGINYAADAPALSDGLAVCFAYPGNSSDCLPSGVAWLSEDPVFGEILEDGTTSVELTFDATLPETSQPGAYLAGLVLMSDDPMGPLVIPVTMTVEVPADDGRVGGTVIGWNHCDMAAFELEDAVIFVESANGVDQWSATTDVSGTYGLWIDESHSPVTVTVTADGYVPSVEVVVFSAAMPADTFHQLRMDAPCFAMDAYALDFTVTQGHTTTEEMMLSNLGAGMLEISDVMVDAGWMVPGMTAGTVAPDDDMPMDVVFSAVDMPLGPHFGELVIMSNDPMVPAMTVPVTMTVVTPTVMVDVFATPPSVTHPGDTITYTIIVTNTSDGPVNIELMNTIPVSTTYIDGSVTGGLDFVQPTTGAEYVTWSGELMQTPEDSTLTILFSKTFTFAVVVDEDITGGTIDDTAVVTAGESVFQDTESVLVEFYRIFLPLTMRNH